MLATLSGLDHALIATVDLEAARATWQRLGFTPTPRGRHIGRGTGNYCLMLPQDYLELIGIVSSLGPPSRLPGLLARRGEGLIGAALSPASADAAFAEAKAAGLDPQPPAPLGRLLEAPEGMLEPRFSLVELPAEIVPDFRLFFCQHLTPDLVRRPAWLQHANTARYIAELAIATDEPGRLAEPLGRLFGPTEQQAGMLSVRAGRALLRFATAELLGSRFGAAGGGYLALAVGDLQAAARCLDDGGIAFARQANGALRLAPSEATGIALEFRA